MDPLLASTPCISGRGVSAVNTCTPEEEAQRISWDGVHPTSRMHEIFALAGYALAESPLTQAAVADTRFSERRNSSLVKARARRRVKHRGSITLPIALVDVGSVTALVGVGVSTAAG